MEERHVKINERSKEEELVLKENRNPQIRKLMSRGTDRSISKMAMSESYNSGIIDQIEKEFDEELFKNKPKADNANLNETDTRNSTLKKIDEMLESIWWTIIFTILTIFALFSDDVKIITSSKSADATFSAFVIFVLSCFVIELVLASIAQKNYIFSFFFFLDLISIITMFLDIHWVSEAIIFSMSETTASDDGQLATLGKESTGAKIGNRAFKVLRIMRLVRLVRISKLYKATHNLEVSKKGSSY